MPKLFVTHGIQNNAIDDDSIIYYAMSNFSVEKTYHIIERDEDIRELRRNGQYEKKIERVLTFFEPGDIVFPTGDRDVLIRAQIIICSKILKTGDVFKYIEPRKRKLIEIKI